MPKSTTIIDGNEAAASVAYRLSEVIAIYPITPSSPMAELSDEWVTHKQTNIWGTIPSVVEMQSEGGAAGAVHGAVQAGSLATTFTSSQGLLLMIPNLYKIAGELTPFCIHVAARTLATHALSIFGDHSDVMACRQTGFAMLSSENVQQAHDMALIAHATTVRARIPFMHFFDGFRTSHELNVITPLSDDDLRSMMDPAALAAHRARGLTPDHPVVRGTAQNPDVFFQAREACSPYYESCPALVQEMMDQFAARTGRQYHLFDYHGHPQAERVIIAMGSGAETVAETVEWLAARGERVGSVTVHLFRPFSIADFVDALPASVQSIAVLDRTKEPGGVGEPLYLDIVAALDEAEAAGRIQRRPNVIGGRFGLSSKEFTPAMAKAVCDELLRNKPKRRFTVGIVDDVSDSSLSYDPAFHIETGDVTEALFFGLGADGTVGANKNSLKIITKHTDQCGQGYFVYDSKKSGAVTVSHLRFAPKPVRAPWLIREASFVACHHFPLLERNDVFETAAVGATVLLNVPGGADAVWDLLQREAQQIIIDRKLTVWAIDAGEVTRAEGLGGRINTVMQTCFFALTKRLPIEQAVEYIKQAVVKTYGRRGEEAVRRNHAVIDQALAHLKQVKIPDHVTATHSRPAIVGPDAPAFVQRVTATILAGHGDLLPVSAFPVDGTWPVGTARYEKRRVATALPVWHSELCIQCNKCSLVCPHAAIRVKAVPEAALADAPEGYVTLPYRGSEFEGFRYTLQGSPDDCTGCTLCVAVCPGKSKTDPKQRALSMEPAEGLRDSENANFDFFLKLPETPRDRVPLSVKHTQLFEPLFEFSGACAGCGETPYVKLLTQLFGDRTVIANATGCSSIYGGNLPTTPYTTNPEGRGPAWANSLFEDNAEFGLGIRAALDQFTVEAQRLLIELAPTLGLEVQLAADLAGISPADEAGLARRRAAVAELMRRLDRSTDPKALRLRQIAEHLVRKNVWVLGGDGWAYDIGFGGLDHVMASNFDINVMVMDTEVYSNTGGQQSKATPTGASAKFASAGRVAGKKNLGMMAMTYGHVYVAQIAMGARDVQAVKALQEAESYPGPSLVIAYGPCVAHGFDLSRGLDHQKMAVESGHWPLFRYDPRRLDQGKPPLEMDSAAPKGNLEEFMANESRFRSLERANPERYHALIQAAEAQNKVRYDMYHYLASFSEPTQNG
ncbi:MAG: pyruvate:ferredoxin (flavodoxin) oxidoreductase [Azospirillaceae bacterium]|nr:pyruvate:ferredoxin (flavodoxin) oxidoreductase [Azospirillaceae bacterium]